MYRACARDEGAWWALAGPPSMHLPNRPLVAPFCVLPSEYPSALLL